MNESSSDRSAAPTTRHPAAPALPFGAILPGFLFILTVDVWAFLGTPDSVVFLEYCWIPVTAVLPWLTLLAVKRRPDHLGYRRERAAADFGWGAFFGALWRGLSMALNLFFVGRKIGLGVDGVGLINALVLVPLVEETFFRGYLGRAFTHHVGRWKGIVLQALLFTFHPSHLRQGVLAWVSIFGFGILAGWLVDRTGSIWAAWGAHACANLLPLLLIAIT